MRPQSFKEIRLLTFEDTGTSESAWDQKSAKLCTCSCLDKHAEEASRNKTERAASFREFECSKSLAKKIHQDLVTKALDRVPFERVNIQIEVGKLGKLVTETLNILTFAMCVPQMVDNDYAVLSKHLPEADLEAVKALVEPINFKTCSLFSAGEYEFRKANFFTESSASSVEEFYSTYKDKFGDVAYKKETEDAWTAVNLLYELSKEHPQIFVEEMKAKLPDHIKEMLETFAKLFNHVLREMGKSPKVVEEEQINLSKMFLAFEQLGNEMLHLHSELRPAIEANLLKIMNVSKEVQSLRDQRKKLKEFLVHSHQRIRNNLEKNTMMYNLDAMKTTKEKMGPRKELINKHQNLVKEDLAEEKALRVKKYKIEQVLQGIINKYEEDMSDRQKKLAHLNSMYDQEMEQFKNMQERFDAQDKVYTLLMNEKEKYERSVWEAKLKDIQRKIAARKIQRFYRGYLAFMVAHGRKKGKGKGKGKGKKRS